MAKTHYKIKQRLVNQAISEKDFDIRYRRNKTQKDWKLNDQLRRSYDAADAETKSKVALFQAIAFEETLLSKIDNSLVWKMSPSGPEDKFKAEKANALRLRDSKVDRWDFKDRMGKRKAIGYGRAIYTYDSGSKDGYKPNLQYKSPRHFYIDPNVGGRDIEEARHMGWDDVQLTRKELMDGIEAGIYDETATKRVLAAGGNYTYETQEDVEERTAGNDNSSVAQSKRAPSQDIFVFTQHFTIDYETGDRYVLLFNEAGEAIRCEKWTDVDPSGMYPVWTWATSPDADEFWSVSPLTRVRKIFKAMEKAINQMLDNADQINKPKLAVNVDLVRNLPEVKFGTKGFIEITGNTNVQQAVMAVPSPAIDTPLRVYDKLQLIIDRESGVSAGAAGVDDTDGVLGIYQGNQMNLSDRIALLNKEYTEGYYAFAQRWLNGVKNNLTSKVAVQILGIEGAGIEEIMWSDIKPTKYDYDIIVESSSAESQMNEKVVKGKNAALDAAKGDQYFNQRVVREKQLEIVQFSEDERRELLDQNEGESGMYVKAHRDLEKLMLGKEVKPPRNATLYYVQKLTDLWEERDEMIGTMQKSEVKATLVHNAIQKFIEEAQQIAEKNLAEQMLLEQAQQGMVASEQPEEGGKGGKIGAEAVTDPMAVGAPQEPTV